jgi:hypothetical protein
MRHIAIVGHRAAQPRGIADARQELQLRVRLSILTDGVHVRRPSDAEQALDARNAGGADAVVAGFRRRRRDDVGQRDHAQLRQHAEGIASPRRDTPRAVGVHRMTSSLYEQLQQRRQL